MPCRVWAHEWGETWYISYLWPTLLSSFPAHEHTVGNNLSLYMNLVKLATFWPELFWKHILQEFWSCLIFWYLWPTLLSSFPAHEHTVGNIYYHSYPNNCWKWYSSIDYRSNPVHIFIGCKMLDLVGPKWKFSVAKQLWFNRRPTNSVASLFHFSCHNIIIQVKASQFWHCALTLFVIHEKIVSSNFRQRSNIWFYKNT